MVDTNCCVFVIYIQGTENLAFKKKQKTKLLSHLSMALSSFSFLATVFSRALGALHFMPCDGGFTFLSVLFIVMMWILSISTLVFCIVTLPKSQ